MKAFTRRRLEELVDILNSKIHNSVISGRNVRDHFTTEESAQYMLASIALDQDGQEKGACAEQAHGAARALRRKKPEFQNLSVLFEDAVGRFSVADVQHELERAGMGFDKNRTLARCPPPSAAR